jgi:hypothetical protein
VTEWLDELHLEPGPPWWSMGTRALGAGHGFLSDADEAADLSLKAELLATRHQEVFAALDTASVAAGSRATLELVETVTGRRADATRHPLDAAGRLVQEDLCLLVLRDGDAFLDAASLCFPSYWRLADKLGRRIDEVHGPIPRYDHDLGGRVARFIERLKPGRPVWRRNWSIHDDPSYFLPEPNPQPPGDSELYLRSERQTLRRLPDTDTVLFTIRTQQVPLAAIEERADLALRMAAVIAAWPPDVVAYKGGHGAKRALDRLRGT